MTTVRKVLHYATAKPARPRISRVAFVLACELSAAGTAWGIHALIVR